MGVDAGADGGAAQGQFAEVVFRGAQTGPRRAATWLA